MTKTNTDTKTIEWVQRKTELADPVCFFKRTIGKAMWQTGKQSEWKGY